METDLGAHLSIGEVLSLLKDEFPDVTISKIRFLESQGLIDPERTPSGYRKFYEADIERLRWVLRQQRDHFLPLKVIKAKLDQGDMGTDDPVPDQPGLFGEPAPDAEGPDAEGPAGAGRSAPAAEEPVAGPADPGSEAADPSGSRRDPGAWLTELQEGPRRPRARPAASRPVEPLIDPDEPAEARHYGTDELAEAAGVEAALVDQLVEFGLLRLVRVGGQTAFEGASLEVVRAAAAFRDRGVEVRHLRAFKLAADREAGLYEQLILPLLRQRNPRARREAAALVSELGDQGEALRRALLRQALLSHVAPR